MAIGNMEMKCECSPEYLHIGTARTKYDKETEKGKHRRENMEQSNVGLK